MEDNLIYGIVFIAHVICIAITAIALSYFEHKQEISNQHKTNNKEHERVNNLNTYEESTYPGMYTWSRTISYPQRPKRKKKNLRNRK